MPAGTWNLTIEQGASWTSVLTWHQGDTDTTPPVDLTGYTARMQIRAPDDTIVLELTTANSRITLGGVDGTITLALTAAETAALEPRSGLTYDLELVTGAAVTRLVQGRAVISPEVTR